MRILWMITAVTSMGLGNVRAHAEQADSPRPTVSSLLQSASASAPSASATAAALPPAAVDSIQAPRPLEPLTVDYPARAQGQQQVIVELLVGVAGDVTEVTAVEGAEPFASAAVRAAAGWFFTPAVSHGERLPARIRVQVQFTPPSDSPTDATTPPPVPPATPASEPPVEVIVVGELPTSRRSLGRADVRQLPGAFGDPFRAIEALPGVTPIVSGMPYFYVRGAPPGNVGYFFDDLNVPLLYHGAAGPGVIHPEFIENVSLHPGAYPAKLGRYAGGIVEGELAQPRRRARGKASVRLIDAGGFVEIPLAEGRANLMLGGRYSYAGLLLSLLSPDVNVGYWDYQALGSYAVTQADELSLFAFGSHDYVAGVDDAGQDLELLDLTFHRARVKYVKTFSPAMRASASVFGGLSRTALNENEHTTVRNVEGQMLGARVSVEHRVDSTFSLELGGDSYWSRTGVDGFDEPVVEQPQQFRDEPVGNKGYRGGAEPTDFSDVVELPSSILPNDPTSRLPPAEFPPKGGSNIVDFLGEGKAQLHDQFTSRSDWFSGLWLELGWRPMTHVYLKPAIRFDSFRYGNTSKYAVDPRLTARFRISPTLTMVHTIGTAHQAPSFVIPVPGLSGPVDGTLQTAVQSSAGAEFTLPRAVSASITGFQNVTLNSTDVLSSSRFIAASDATDPFFDRTTAHSYGVELLVQRSFTQDLGGLLAYTLSRSTRSTDRASGISSFDRTHVINLGAAYDLGSNWRLGARIVTYSGIPASVGNPRALSAPPRTSWFYRLDWRLEKRWALGAAGGWISLVADVVNTTLHKEALNAICYAYGCTEQTFGPITLPSLGVEASF